MSNPFHSYETDNGDRNLTSFVEVFSMTNSGAFTREVVLVASIGDGTKNLSSSGDTVLTFRVKRDGIFVQDIEYTIPDAFNRAQPELGKLLVKAGSVLSIELLSDGADSDVDVTVEAVDAAALQALTSGNDPFATLATADKLLGYFKLALRSDTALYVDRLTEILEINSDEGSGVGEWDNASASMEGLIDVLGGYSPYLLSINTLLQRIGGFSGTGVNTILGCFKALLNKAASLPSDIGGTGDPSTDSNEALAEAIDAISAGSGSGAFEINVTIQDEDTVAIPDCDVILTSSSTDPRTGIIANGKTNGSGVVTFYLDDGAYYVWRQKAGINFDEDNPVTMVVDTFGNVSYP